MLGSSPPTPKTKRARKNSGVENLEKFEKTDHRAVEEKINTMSRVDAKKKHEELNTTNVTSSGSASASGGVCWETETPVMFPRKSCKTF